MERFAIKFAGSGAVACGCGMCGQVLPSRSGPRVVQADTDEPLCRPCARRHAPQLASLLDLVQTAERVGRCPRHLLTPRMEDLLALARAAENYSHLAPPAPALAAG